MYNGVMLCAVVTGCYVQYTAKDLFKMVLPLIRAEDEIGEVFVSGLGLANPAAFQLVAHTLQCTCTCIKIILCTCTMYMCL